MDEHFLQVTDAATRFRRACERYRDEHDNPFASMKHFPKNCCSLASVAFMRFLRDKGIGEGVLLNFEYDTSKHYRHDVVLINGWTVDLTRDQFDGEDRPVVIEREEDLPRSWELRELYTFDQLGGSRNEEHIRMHRDIQKFL